MPTSNDDDRDRDRIEGLVWDVLARAASNLVSGGRDIPSLQKELTDLVVRERELAVRIAHPCKCKCDPLYEPPQLRQLQSFSDLLKLPLFQKSFSELKLCNVCGKDSTHDHRDTNGVVWHYCMDCYTKVFVGRTGSLAKSRPNKIGELLDLVRANPSAPQPPQLHACQRHPEVNDLVDGEPCWKCTAHSGPGGGW